MKDIPLECPADSVLPPGSKRPGDDPESSGALNLESLSVGANPRFLAVIEEARSQLPQGLGISTDEVRRGLDLK